MATHKSAEKRARQSIKRSARNKQTLGTIRTWEKKLKTAIGAKDSKASQEFLLSYTSKIAKAAKKGVIHARTASRKISRLSKQVSTLGK